MGFSFDEDILAAILGTWPALGGEGVPVRAALRRAAPGATKAAAAAAAAAAAQQHQKYASHHTDIPPVLTPMTNTLSRSS